MPVSRNGVTSNYVEPTQMADKPSRDEQRYLSMAL